METELVRNPDILANLTFTKGKCLVCGEMSGGRFEAERPELWVACSCGHVFPLKNLTTWN